MSKRIRMELEMPERAAETLEEIDGTVLSEALSQGLGGEIKARVVVADSKEVVVETVRERREL